MTATTSTASTVVVDASLGAKLVLAEPWSVETHAHVVRWTRQGTTVLAPGWFACELANLLYQRVKRGQFPVAVAQQLLDNVLVVVTLRDVEPAVARRAIAIADTLGAGAADDSQYTALAEHEGCELWTADEACWRAARSRFPRVRFVSERP